MSFLLASSTTLWLDSSAAAIASSASFFVAVDSVRSYRAASFAALALFISSDVTVAISSLRFSGYSTTMLLR
jgi:hypothetical protein